MQFEFNFDDNEKTSVSKKIRMITLFSGYDSQCMAMQRLGANFEIHKTCEWQTVSTNLMKNVFHAEDDTDYSKELSDEEVKAELIKMGVSINDETPVTDKELSRKGAAWCRKTFNNYRACHNLGSITNFHGEDLEIKEKDKYYYIMFYSFCCQDLSVAGKQKGMARNSNTRSGLLWQVERLLFELKEQGIREKNDPKAYLPDCLMLENVVQLHSKTNMPDFQEWINSLTSLGYNSFWDDINAKNMGIPQNRDRTFMVSLLGNVSYDFPEPIPLEYCMADMLEDEVDEKFFINSDKADNLINQLIEDKKIPDLENE